MTALPALMMAATSIEPGHPLPDAARGIVDERLIARSSCMAGVLPHATRPVPPARGLRVEASYIEGGP